MWYPILLDLKASHPNRSACTVVLDHEVLIASAEFPLAQRHLFCFPMAGLALGVEPWTRLTLTMSEDVFMGHGSLKVHSRCQLKLS